MVKCNCGRELKHLKGKYKFAVQINAREINKYEGSPQEEMEKAIKNAKKQFGLDNTQEIEQKAGRGGAGTPVHSTTDEIVRGKTAVPDGVICKPQTPPSDNTQKTRHSSKTRNCEQKGNSNLETPNKKQNYPSVIEDKLELWFNKWMIKHVSGRCFIEVKEIVNESYNQGIQKAIDVVNNFDFVKLIHLGITGTVFNGYSKEEKEASKIVQDNLLEKLKEL
jgi:hypothetical protein